MRIINLILLIIIIGVTDCKVFNGSNIDCRNNKIEANAVYTPKQFPRLHDAGLPLRLGKDDSLLYFIKDGKIFSVPYRHIRFVEEN